MSRLLFLLPSVPIPLDAGARIRNHGLLKLLGAEHELDAIAFGPSESRADLAGLTRRAMVVPISTLFWWSAAVTSGARPEPFGKSSTASCAPITEPIP